MARAGNTIDTFRFYLLSLLIVFAPLFWAGNRPLPLFVLELGALILLVSLVWEQRRADWVGSKPFWAVIALSVFPLFYVVPLPADFYEWLPGRQLYREVLDLVNDESSWRPLAIYPMAAVDSWLTLLVPIGVFVTCMSLPTAYVRRLIAIFLIVATLEAVLGLIQFGHGPSSFFRFGNINYPDSAVGTYPNRNHLAGLLEMALPVTLGLLTAMLGRQKHRGSYAVGKTDNQRKVDLTLLYAGVALLILLGLVFTRSRTGVSLSMVGVLLCMIAFARRLGGRNVFGIVGTFTAVGIGAMTLVGLAPVLQRFAAHDPLGDVRWTILSEGIEAVGHFFPLGSGPGTFPYVFPQFQSESLSPFFVNHAHNDYLEWLIEGGLLAAVLICWLVVLYCLRWRELWVREEWSVFRFSQIGAGIGLALLLLHSAVDFNLRIPANMVYFALLAGVFFHTEESIDKRSSDESALTNPMTDALPEERTLTRLHEPPNKVKNPFDE